MPTESEKERERLKEEYKDHYQKIRDTKEKLRQSRYVKNISDAMDQMNADELLSSVDDFLGKVRHKMTSIEARLDVAMDQFSEEEDLDIELDEELRKKRAKDTLKDIKQEMGLLYSELEKQAEEINVKKTIGPESEQKSSGKSMDKENEGR